jgi:hypothetical protein
MTVLDYTCSHLQKKVQLAESQLEIVEGDTNLADLQGFIAGAKDVKVLLYQSGFELALDVSSDLTPIEKLTDGSIIVFDNEISAIKNNPKWHEFMGLIADKVVEKKNFLYEDAKRGRDLVFVQGWKKAVEFIDTVFSAIIEMSGKLKEQPTLWVLEEGQDF